MQQLVWRTRWTIYIYKPQVRVLQRPSLLCEGSRLLKKLDFHRTPLAKKCCHIDNHGIISSMLKVIDQRSHPLSWPQCKVWPVKYPFGSQSYRSIPLKFSTNALLYRSLNMPQVSSHKDKTNGGICQMLNIELNSTLRLSNVVHKGLNNKQGELATTVVTTELVRFPKFLGFKNQNFRQSTTPYFWENSYAK